MSNKNKKPEGSNKRAADYYEMTEEASKRSAGTQQVRRAESVDINEESTQGPVSSPAGDDWAENKVATSLDDE